MCSQLRHTLLRNQCYPDVNSTSYTCAHASDVHACSSLFSGNLLRPSYALACLFGLTQFTFDTYSYGIGEGWDSCAALTTFGMYLTFQSLNSSTPARAQKLVGWYMKLFMVLNCILTLCVGRMPGCTSSMYALIFFLVGYFIKESCSPECILGAGSCDCMPWHSHCLWHLCAFAAQLCYCYLYLVWAGIWTWLWHWYRYKGLGRYSTLLVMGFSMSKWLWFVLPGRESWRQLLQSC